MYWTCCELNACKLSYKLDEGLLVLSLDRFLCVLKLFRVKRYLGITIPIQLHYRCVTETLQVRCSGIFCSFKIYVYWKHFSRAFFNRMLFKIACLVVTIALQLHYRCVTWALQVRYSGFFGSLNVHAHFKHFFIPLSHRLFFIIACFIV